MPPAKHAHVSRSFSTCDQSFQAPSGRNNWLLREETADTTVGLDGLAPARRTKMERNLAWTLTETARRHPGRTALRLDDIRLTYRTLDDAAARMAAMLRRRGVEPGDRVGLILPNVPE